jgi:drug/metabolite transporter (DMT)-like permease
LVVIPDWSKDSENQGILGDFLGLASAAFYAVYSTLLKKRIPEESSMSMPIFFGKEYYR